uniref:Uncharacterized protein n=1 Tax=Picea glauca TaxID=3330 RepID=A0A101LW35_PICGL|nr:hypothetical protein ABT39_MTgene1495 [Picea glauca]
MQNIPPVTPRLVTPRHQAILSHGNEVIFFQLDFALLARLSLTFSTQR